jgi:hypothetical protein
MCFFSAFEIPCEPCRWRDCITSENEVTPHAYHCEPAWLVPHYDVLDSVDKLRSEKGENTINHVLMAVVLFVIVGSTITLLVPDAITLLLHVGSATN